MSDDFDDDIPTGSKLMRDNPITGRPDTARLLGSVKLDRDNKELHEMRCPKCNSLLISIKFDMNGLIKNLSVLCVPCGKKGDILEVTAGTGHSHREALGLI